MTKGNSTDKIASMVLLDRALIFAACVIVLLLALLGIGAANAHEVVTCNKYGCSDWHRITRTNHMRHFAVRHHRSHRRLAFDANGNLAGIVVSHDTGARARVSPRWAGKFQAYIDDLEAHGARIRFMGGYRRGRCSLGSQHPCGSALDVCQLSRGRVDRRCHLPPRYEIVRIAAAHGLYEGGRWCNSDYGHVQARESAGACGAHIYSARRHLHRHRHHHRYRLSRR